MQKLTQKQFIKRKTLWILHEILQSLLPEDQQEHLTLNEVYRQFPKANFFKDQETGMIRTGLSFKGVRKLVKKHPHITPEEVKTVFNIG